MVCGLMAVLIVGTIATGGSKEVLSIASKYQRTNMFDFNPDPTVRHTFWTLILGRLSRTLQFAFNQTTLQRLNSIHGKKRANIAIWVFLFLYDSLEVNCRYLRTCGICLLCEKTM